MPITVVMLKNFVFQFSVAVLFLFMSGRPLRRALNVAPRGRPVPRRASPGVYSRWSHARHFAYSLSTEVVPTTRRTRALVMSRPILVTNLCAYSTHEYRLLSGHGCHCQIDRAQKAWARCLPWPLGHQTPKSGPH